MQRTERSSSKSLGEHRAQPGWQCLPVLVFLHQMFNDEICRKLGNILRGIRIEEQTDTCTTVRNHLCSSFSTSTTVKTSFESKSVIKKEQEQFIRELANQHGYWLTQLPAETKYLTKGGESKVYYKEGDESVIKINDGVYYATWLEYFNSLVIHNLLFPSTAYTFLGFTLNDDALHVVLKQPFIPTEGTADLADIKKLLEFNGFKNTRRQDYFHPELGLILEDMHDENVLLKDNALLFIDTVFYVVQPEQP